MLDAVRVVLRPDGASTTVKLGASSGSFTAGIIGSATPRYCRDSASYALPRKGARVTDVQRRAWRRRRQCTELCVTDSDVVVLRFPSPLRPSPADASVLCGGTRSSGTR
eukprot:2158962-Rhodomonas_salina.1